MIYSELQTNIFTELNPWTKNLCISAVAGSGKTTTIVEGLKVLPKTVPGGFLPPKTTFLAFNKAIAETLQQRVPRHVACSTFHSLGFRALKDSGQATRDTKVDGRKCAKLVFDRVGRDCPDVAAIIKLVSLCKSRWPAAQSSRDVEDLLDLHELSFDDPREAISTVLRVLEKSNSDLRTIDFDDMLWLPVLLGCRFSTQDYIFVDEAQDTNDIQLEILDRLQHPWVSNQPDEQYSKTRLCFVGDPWQAIYGFRGANADSMSRITTRFSCKTLPLDVSYRCPKLIVQEAQRWMKD